MLLTSNCIYLFNRHNVFFTLILLSFTFHFFLLEMHFLVCLFVYANRIGVKEL